MATTLVETYECTELQADGMEMSDEMREAARIAEEMGLEGQQSFYRSVEEGVEQVERLNPYRTMTAEERNVFLTLFPEHSRLEKFSAGPVPLRVLQVAAYAKTIGLECWVLAPKGAVNDDPILAGVEGTAPHGSFIYAPANKVFLLARWGDCLLPMADLRAKAQQVMFDKKRRAMISAKTDSDTFEAFGLRIVGQRRIG